jgi:DNA (cytosine-5)-methyltransferase 1
MTALLTAPPVPARERHTSLTLTDQAVLDALDWFMPMLPGDGPTFTDLFCGAGGSSIGLTEAGLRLVFAANHWRRAIETHGENFPWAEHQCTDLDHYDMRNLPDTDVLWASPICVEASPAGGKAHRGNKRPKGQLDLLEQDGHVEQAGYERTRATFYDVMRAAEVHRYKVIVLENVPGVATKWEMFDWWLTGMTNVLDYNAQFISVSSAHIWDEEGNDPAAQWRNRLYIVLTLKGIRQPDVEPRPLARCEVCDQDVHAFQAWKKPGARKIGEYRRQYVYCCPNTSCRHAVVEPYVLPSSSVIDWSDLGTRIGDRKPLWVPNTLRRVKAGLDLYGEPVTAAVAGNTWERPGSGYFRAWPVSHPLTTRTATAGDALVVPPDGAFIIKNKGGYCTPEQNLCPISGPLSTVTGKDSHALVVPRQPLRTTGPVDLGDVLDCRGRMLKPREHLRAQRFRDTYRVHGNPSEQTMQAGNAVSANVAHWIGRAIMAVL